MAAVPERESIAAVADTIELSGLKEAALLYANRISECAVFVSGVELRQAPALLELLIKAKRMPPGWVISCDERLRQLSRLANELSIIEEVVLPLLMEDAADLDGVRLLHQYGWSIRHIAQHVDKPGGPFFLAATEASSFVLGLQDHLKSGARSVEFLRKNLEDLRVKIGEFKQLMIRLPAEVGVEEELEEEAAVLVPELESVAAMAEKADMIGVSGLKEAALLLANRNTRCRVFITAVQLRQAPALLELLTNAKRMPPGWVIRRDKKLRQLSRLANELSIVEEVVLPLLMEDAADVDGVRLLHQYGWSIRHIARHVDKPGGPFFLAAAEASSFVLSLQGHLKSRTRSVEFLRKNLEDVRVKIGEFKQFTVHLPAEVGVEEDGVDGRLVAGEDEEGHQV